MISITKDESIAIRAALPDVHIVRTARQKSKRHHYYCEESREVARLIRRMRGLNDPETERGRGVAYADRARRRRDKV